MSLLGAANLKGQEKPSLSLRGAHQHRGSNFQNSGEKTDHLGVGMEFVYPKKKCGHKQPISRELDHISFGPQGWYIWVDDDFPFPILVGYVIVPWKVYQLVLLSWISLTHTLRSYWASFPLKAVMLGRWWSGFLFWEPYMHICTGKNFRCAKLPGVVPSLWFSLKRTLRLQPSDNHW